MNSFNAFQSYTPRPHPISYDSLENEIGCQPLSGTDVFSLKAFDLFCVAEHDPESPIFSQDPLVTYCAGPFEPAGDRPFRYLWSFWVATAGIRAGKVGLVTPPADDLGVASDLYPSTTPTDLSAAFDRDGFLNLAIQKSAATIEIKAYTSEEGNTITASFTGYAPLLFYTGLAFSGTEGVEDDVVCFYLLAEKPLSLFARFRRENYATQYVIHSDLPKPLARLIAAQVVDREVQLYALDKQGFDITLHSPEYAVDAGHEESTLDVAVDSGAYVETAVAETADTDFAELTISIDAGNYFDAIVNAPSITPDEATLSIAIAGGSYVLKT